MILGPIYLIAIILIRPITATIHELGHGLSALLLTRNNVRLYIGYFGDPIKMIQINLGRLEIFFKYYPFRLNLGCSISKGSEIPVIKDLLIILFGPITSLLFGLTCIFVAFQADLHGSMKLISVFLLIASLIDFFVDVIPSKDPIMLFEGLIVYNDGQQLSQFIRHKIVPSQINIGVELYNEKDYSRASFEFRNILNSGIRNKRIYELAVSAFLLSNKYREALLIQEEFEKDYQLSSDDYARSGLIKSLLERYDEGILDYEKSLEINPGNGYSIINKAYTLNLMGQYEKAIVEFDRAIELNLDLAYSYCNRGLSKIKLGNEKEGLEDINKSFDYDNSNSYAYRNLGIYYYDKADYENAKIHFEKSFSLDSETHLLRDYISKSNNELNKAGT